MLGLTAVALALRLYGVWFGWPHVFHPDEARVIVRSLRMLEWGDPNPHFFTYPSLYLYLLSFVLAHATAFASYADQPALFHVIARGANVVIGAATVPLMYRLAYRVSGRTAALVAAAALAVHPLHVEESHFATTDGPATLLFTAGLWYALAAYETATLRQYLFAGAVSGLAMSTKYPAGLVFLGVCSAGALACLDGRGRPSYILRRLLVAGLAFVTAFFLGTPFAAFDPRAFLDDMLTEWIATRTGFLGATHPDPLYYVAGLGPVLVGAALLGALSLAWKRPRALVVLLAGSLPLAVLLSGSVIKLDRYILPLVPVACVFMGCFVAWAAEAVGERLRIVVATGLAALLLAAPAGQAAACSAAQASPDPRVEAAAWIEGNLPSGALVSIPAHGWMAPPLHSSRLQVITMSHLYDDRVRERILWEQRVLADPALRPLLERLLARRVHTPEMAERRLKTLPAIEDVAYSPDVVVHPMEVYVIMSSAFTELYEDPDTERAYPRSTASWRGFFSDVERRGRLLMEWRSPAESCGSFLRSPTIRLYRVGVA